MSLRTTATRWQPLVEPCARHGVLLVLLLRFLCGLANKRDPDPSVVDGSLYVRCVRKSSVCKVASFAAMARCFMTGSQCAAKAREPNVTQNVAHEEYFRFNWRSTVWRGLTCPACQFAPVIVSPFELKCLSHCCVVFFVCLFLNDNHCLVCPIDLFILYI